MIKVNMIYTINKSPLSVFICEVKLLSSPSSWRQRGPWPGALEWGWSATCPASWLGQEGIILVVNEFIFFVVMHYTKPGGFWEAKEWRTHWSQRSCPSPWNRLDGVNSSFLTYPFLCKFPFFNRLDGLVACLDMLKTSSATAMFRWSSKYCPCALFTFEKWLDKYPTTSSSSPQNNHTFFFSQTLFPQSRTWIQNHVFTCLFFPSPGMATERRLETSKLNTARTSHGDEQDQSQIIQTKTI